MLAKLRTFLGKSTVEFAAHLSILLFNEGKESTMKRMLGVMGIEKTQCVKEYSRHFKGLLQNHIPHKYCAFHFSCPEQEEWVVV